MYTFLYIKKDPYEWFCAIHINTFYKHDSPISQHTILNNVRGSTDSHEYEHNVNAGFKQANCTSAKIHTVMNQTGQGSCKHLYSY